MGPTGPVVTLAAGPSSSSLHVSLLTAEVRAVPPFMTWRRHQAASLLLGEAATEFRPESRGNGPFWENTICGHSSHMISLDSQRRDAISSFGLQYLTRCLTHSSKSHLSCRERQGLASDGPGLNPGFMTFYLYDPGEVI